MKNKFSWGDAVVVKQNAPQHLHPGEFGSICSVSELLSEQEAKEFNCQVGGWVYTVEFENGSDIQIAECYLDKDLGIIRGKEISQYNNHFVNGVVFNVKMDINCIEIQMKSSLICQSIADDFLLSGEGFFKGKVIATQIESIVIDNSSHSTGCQQEGRILMFEISDQILKLFVEWGRSKTTLFEVKSGQIWWEKQS
jgi:hypothetical protein